MNKVEERIVNEIYKEMHRTNKVGDEAVYVSLNITEEEFKTLSANTRFHYAYDYDQEILDVTSSEYQLSGVKVIIANDGSFVDKNGTYYFEEIVDCDKDLEELENILDCGTITMNAEDGTKAVVEFWVTYRDESNILKSEIEIMDIL